MKKNIKKFGQVFFVVGLLFASRSFASTQKKGIIIETNDGIETEVQSDGFETLETLLIDFPDENEIKLTLPERYETSYEELKYILKLRNVVLQGNKFQIINFLRRTIYKNVTEIDNEIISNELIFKDLRNVFNHLGLINYNLGSRNIKNNIDRITQDLKEEELNFKREKLKLYRKKHEEVVLSFQQVIKSLEVIDYLGDKKCMMDLIVIIVHDFQLPVETLYTLLVDYTVKNNSHMCLLCAGPGYHNYTDQQVNDDVKKFKDYVQNVNIFNAFLDEIISYGLRRGSCPHAIKKLNDQAKIDIIQSIKNKFVQENI